MKNVKVTVKGDTLTLEINLKEKGDLSKSGNSMLVATSAGNAEVPGTDLKFGLNVFKPVAK